MTHRGVDVTHAFGAAEEVLCDAASAVHADDLEHACHEISRVLLDGEREDDMCLLAVRCTDR